MAQKEALVDSSLQLLETEVETFAGPHARTASILSCRC